MYSHLYKGKVRRISDLEYTNNHKWVIGELMMKVKNVKGNFSLVPHIHFFVTVTRQYIPFEQLQEYMDRNAEIFEITVEVTKASLCRCTGKKDISGEWVFENDIVESHDGTVVLYPELQIKYGTYEAYCPHDNCYVPSVGFYAVGEDFPEMPIGNLEDYAKVIGNITDK